MNTTTIQQQPGGSRGTKTLCGLLACGLILAVSGCSTTRQVDKVVPSGFLGNEYSMMKEHEKDRAVLYYQAPDVKWSQYTKLWIKPVEIWKSDDKDTVMGKLSPEKQQWLADAFYQAVHSDLSPEFVMVTNGGPHVLVMRLAITDVKKSRPVLNLVSSLYPAALAISYGKQLITGTGTGVGDVQVECEISDGATGKVLVAGVDRRAGTKAIRTKFGGTYGDVKLAFHWWAQRMATRTVELGAGDPAKRAAGVQVSE